MSIERSQQRAKAIKICLKKLEETYPQIRGMAEHLDFKGLGNAVDWLPSLWHSFPNAFCSDSGVNFLAAGGRDLFELQPLHAHTPEKPKA